MYKSKVLFIALGLTLSLGCNIADPIAGPPVVLEECDVDADCDGAATCGDDGQCVCDSGYSGADCDECARNHYRDGDLCLPVSSCQGTIVDDMCEVDTCPAGQVLSQDGNACVVDLCVDEPCAEPGQIEGTCTMPSDTTTQCDCAAGWTGDDCELPPDSCAAEPCGEFGVCTDGGDGSFSCACAERFAGDTCDTCEPPYANVDSQCRDCEPGRFGRSCTLTCETAEANGWWDANWGARRSIIVEAPAMQTAPSGSTISLTFDHASLVNAGLSSGGSDIRITWVDPTDGSQVPLPRILGVDSDWNQPNTTILWASQRELRPNDADLYYLYFSNQFPPRPNEVAASVLPPSRGWARTTTGEILYSPHRLPRGDAGAALTLIQIRQTDETSFEAYFTDESDSGQANARVYVTDPNNNTIFDSGDVGDLGGTRGSPMTRLIPFEINALDFNLRIESADGNGTNFILGQASDQRAQGLQILNRSYSRGASMGPDPLVVETCDRQDRP